MHHCLFLGIFPWERQQTFSSSPSPRLTSWLSCQVVGAGGRGQLPPSLNELFAVLGATFDLSVYWQQYPFLFDGLFGEGVCRLRAFLSEMWVIECCYNVILLQCNIVIMLVCILYIFPCNFQVSVLLSLDHPGLLLWEVRRHLPPPLLLHHLGHQTDHQDHPHPPPPQRSQCFSFCLLH